MDKRFLESLCCVDTILSFLFFLFFFVPITSAASQQDIVFNEISWAGSSVSADDEWIELRNTTNQEIDLSHYTLAIYNSASLGFDNIVFSFGVKIPANGFFLISAKDHNFDITSLQIDSDFVTPLHLDDNNFQIKLFDENQNLIDTAGDTNAPFKGSGYLTFATMVRFPDNSLNGDVLSSWFTSQETINLNSPTSNIGNPANNETVFIVGFPEVIYEDGEGLNISDKWSVYDKNPRDPDISLENGAVVIDGEIMQEYYFSPLEYNISTSVEADPYNGTAIKLSGLHNDTHLHASFRFKSITDSKFTIYIRVKTNNGFRYLEYTPGDVSWLGIDYSSEHSWISNNEYIHHYLGSNANNGQWHYVERDLQADLSSGGYEIIEYVEGFYIRMTGEIDDLRLFREDL